MSSRPHPQAPGDQPRRAAPSPWFTRRAVAGHVALVIWIPGCVVATYWQVGIAVGGDALGWVYSVMWPAFAIFGTIFWWFLVHDDPDTLGARGLRRATASVSTAGVSPVGTSSDVPSPDDVRTATPGSAGQHGDRTDPGSPVTDPVDAERLARAEKDDPELAAYNAYLSELAEHGKTWRRR